MKRGAVLWLAAILTVAATSVAGAQSAAPGDLDGREIAAKLCSNCHLVDGTGAATPRADVPSFASIANGPHAAPERLAAAIILPHPAMPGVPLTRAEIQAIIGYIVSLKK